jgi:hypothetical protein
MHGVGTIVYPDGAVYEGQFRGGQCHGAGRHVFGRGGAASSGWRGWVREGDAYDGGWRRNMRHGTGVWTWGRNGRQERLETRDNRITSWG